MDGGRGAEQTVACFPPVSAGSSLQMAVEIITGLALTPAARGSLYPKKFITAGVEEPVNPSIARSKIAEESTSVVRRRCEPHDAISCRFEPVGLFSGAQ